MSHKSWVIESILLLLKVASYVLEDKIANVSDSDKEVYVAMHNRMYDLRVHSAQRRTN